MELASQLFQLIVYLLLFVTIMRYYSLPLHIVRDVYVTFVSFKERLKGFLRYRVIMANLDRYLHYHCGRYLSSLLCRFPSPSAVSLERDARCVVCHDDIDLTTGKQLLCGHIFHRRCLRSWMEQQQVCPMCREPVDPSGIRQAPQQHQRAAPNVNMQQQQQQQQQPIHQFMGFQMNFGAQPPIFPQQPMPPAQPQQQPQQQAQQQQQQTQGAPVNIPPTQTQDQPSETVAPNPAAPAPAEAPQGPAQAPQAPVQGQATPNIPPYGLGMMPGQMPMGAQGMPVMVVRDAQGHQQILPFTAQQLLLLQQQQQQQMILMQALRLQQSNRELLEQLNELTALNLSEYERIMQRFRQQQQSLSASTATESPSTTQDQQQQTSDTGN